jgi:hypothetical protein
VSEVRHGGWHDQDVIGTTIAKPVLIRHVERFAPQFHIFLFNRIQQC